MIEQLFVLLGGEGVLPVVVEVLIVLFALAVIASLLVEGLKMAGLVPEGHAGRFSAGINTVLAIVVVLLQQMGAAEKLAGAEEFAAALSTLILFVVVQIAGSKLFYELGKRTGLFGSPARG